MSTKIEIELTTELYGVLDSIATETGLPVNEVVLRALVYGVVKQYKE